MQKKHLRLLALVLSFLMLLATPFAASAAQPEDTVIRVGIFDYEAFYGTDADGEPYGYGYEYLNALAKYGGFRYEYVYGSWAECLTWLESGEIDMLDSAQKYAEREEKFLFSEYSTGLSYGELFVRSDNSSILYNDFPAMDGITVGMLEQNSRNDTFFAFAQSRGFSVNVVMFRTATELSDALQSGLVDAIVSSNLRHGKNEKSVARFAPTPFFLMFCRNRPDLKTRVDAALEQILIDSPNFNALLNEKYYATQAVLPVFTKTEAEFINAAPALRVAYDEAWAPFVSTLSSTGEAYGINVDLLELIGQKTGLQFTYVSAPSAQQAAALVASGEADVLLGLEATPQSLTKLRLSATDAFLSVPLCLVGRSMSIDEHAVFAIPQSGTDMLWVVKDQFPGSSVIMLPSAAECYAALQSGQADFTMDNIYSAMHTIAASETEELMISFITPVRDYYSLALPENADPTLLRIFNKGIAAISQTELNSVFTRHTMAQPAKLTLGGVLYQHRFVLALILAGVALLLLCIVYFFYRRNKKQQQQLWQTAYIDKLTGIANINLFQEKARALLDKHPHTKYGVCKFDIENFKLLNEIYGFDCGDRIIQCLAREIGDVSVPGTDTYARISGDDFIILKSYERIGDNIALLDESERKVRDAVAREFGCIIKLKFGIYRIDDNAESISSILEKANYAHSFCKASPNLSKYIYDETVKQNAIEEKKIEARMEDALRQRQFLLYLQPKYRLSDETLAGAEALVRWRGTHDDDIVFPSSFIPLFEKNGFITKLDMYMLERTCELIRSWMDSGKTPVTISINFSRLHLLNPGFTREICATVDRFGVPRGYIEIELTESAMFDNEEAMFAVLESLHEEGFTLSMDDFGTGYSSLGLLKNLPVDVIKIDRSFFLNSRFKTRARAVIENVMQMAKRLEIHTVAEGVETQEHIDMLREMGCEIVQGYYYSRPVPADEFRLERVATPIRQAYPELRLETGEIGDLTIGRAEMGETTSVFAYRLFQVTVRKMLSDAYGEGEMMFVLRGAGKLAGSMFAREFLDLTLPFDDFVLALSKKLQDLKIGKMAVERFDMETGAGAITVSGDLDCSGMTICSQTLCQYDEGFLAGILKEYTRQSYSVVETDCWGTGATLCRFEIKPN